MSHKYTNALKNESSPYLLQHAGNPVAWEAWRPEILKRAAKENKLVLVSIGYAACHWCHVMERECFEDEDVARVMNTYYIPVKVDREERPDIDHIYMDALQLMTGGGGWPLNIVALPDGRPFWGATYVKKGDWIRILEQLADLYEKDPQKVRGYAANLAEGIKTINLVPPGQDTELLTPAQVDQLVGQWAAQFDTRLGGHKRAPKFMMPVALNFLLNYAYTRKSEEIMEYVHTTLTKMAYGGIFDHVGGGFSRYSVDVEWHIPHFEKMLYDNAQLISLYAQAYSATGNTLYKEVVQSCIAFVKAELMAPDHGFYSSLDADSVNEEGHLEEGAFYIWREPELRSILGSEYELFADYYNIDNYGHWEAGKYVLIRDASDQEVAGRHNIPVTELRKRLETCRTALLQERETRSGPRLDNKVLASWNGLMLKALCDSYRYLGDEQYLELALNSAGFIMGTLSGEHGKLFHSRSKNNRIDGYLEDYSCIIESFLALYQVSFDEKWLKEAKRLTDHCIAHFFDGDSKMFYFTANDAHYVVRRTLETTDNVIPSSNSILAKCLFLLSRYFPENGYAEKAGQMLANMREAMTKYSQSHSNWLQL
jgi:uncharacterized protein YyaL (SSP411 family)